MRFKADEIVSVLREEIDQYRAKLDAREVYTKSMRQRLDLDLIYRRALRELPQEVDGKPPLSAPAECPFSLEELLGEE